MGAVLHTNLLIFLLQSVVLSPSWSSVNWDATYERAVDLEINSHLPLWSKTKVFEYSFIDIYTTVLVLVSFSNRDQSCSSWQIVQQWNLIKNYGFCLVWWSGGPGSSSSKNNNKIRVAWGSQPHSAEREMKFEFRFIFLHIFHFTFCNVSPKAFRVSRLTKTNLFCGCCVITINFLDLYFTVLYNFAVGWIFANSLQQQNYEWRRLTDGEETYKTYEKMTKCTAIVDQNIDKTDSDSPWRYLQPLLNNKLNGWNKFNKPRGM